MARWGKWPSGRTSGVRHGKRFFLDLEERLVAGFVKVKDKEANND